MNSTNSRVVLFHPSTAPFVQHAAGALHEADLLERYITALRDNPDSLLQRLVTTAGEIAGFDAKRQFGKRKITEVPESFISDWPLREFLRTVISRVDSKGILTDRVWEWAETGFDAWVAKNCIKGAAAVYGYEHASAACFEAAKQQRKLCIYDVQAPEHDFTQEIINKEIERIPELQTPYQKYIRQHHARRTQRRREEWKNADLVIAASEFTKQSYEKAGLSVEKVEIIPYGAPPVVEAGLEGGTQEDAPLRFLWAGTFSVRKGGGYLLDAWKQLPGSSNCELVCFGAQGMPASLLSELPNSIIFNTGIPRDELAKEYIKSDVLLFPTLCDGFGMVVTEAFAHGLPVITTTRAGASDFLRHEENGLLIEPESSSAIVQAVRWCIDHRAQLKELRSAALETARNWQWSDYRKRLADCVGGLLETGGR